MVGDGGWVVGAGWWVVGSGGSPFEDKTESSRIQVGDETETVGYGHLDVVEVVLLRQLDHDHLLDHLHRSIQLSV